MLSACLGALLRSPRPRHQRALADAPPGASDHRHRHVPGGGWLPRKWLSESGLDAATREVSRRGVDATLGGYGDPMEFAPLREQLSRRLSEHSIDASPNQILLTSGVSGGIGLVARHLVRPDDVVLVDDPGHPCRSAHMRALAATVRGVAMTRTGPDLDQLEAIARTHRARLYITAPIVHNPTGCTIPRQRRSGCSSSPSATTSTSSKTTPTAWCTRPGARYRSRGVRAPRPSRRCTGRAVRGGAR